jgi:CDP-diacylglycerol pyrophosphatase
LISLPTPPDTLYDLAQCCATDLKKVDTCSYVSSKYNYVIVEDGNEKKKPVAYPIIPIAKVTGIEDAKIYDKPYLNYWESGWAYVVQNQLKPAAHQNHKIVAMAINSKPARDMNQLHIHLSCVRADIKGRPKKASTDRSKPIKVDPPPNGNPREAVVMKSKSVTEDDSPYNMITKFRGVKNHMDLQMDLQSVAVIQSDTADEFYVVDTYAPEKDKGEVEELLDHSNSCPYEGRL